MINRRHMLAGTVAAACVGGIARGQSADDRAYGLPVGTRPFGPDVYRERRQRLMGLMKDGVAVVYGPATIDQASILKPIDGAVSDFAYLTGLVDEPGAALLLAPGERVHREFLFLPSRNPETERYEGVRLPLGGMLRSRAGFERVGRISALGSLLAQIAGRAGAMHYVGPLVSPDSAVPRELDLYSRVTARVPGTRVVNSAGLVRAMRAAKEPREIALMRKAIEATGRGMRAAMRAARPGMREFELRDIIEAEFRAAGARRLAFATIAGVARNSTVLHGAPGDTEFRDGDLILCDIGAEWDHYASDITRTFPVGRSFSPEQRQVYETVLAAQDAAAAKLRPGAHYDDLQTAANVVMDRVGRRDDFWHGLGHFVGLDVHDVGDYSAPLPAGAVITIEPGIYLPDRNFGVRIEDEYLVTAVGSEHLSRAIPRTVADVEAAVAG